MPNRRYKILTVRPSTGALNTWGRKIFSFLELNRCLLGNW